MLRKSQEIVERGFYLVQSDSSSLTSFNWINEQVGQTWGVFTSWAPIILLSVSVIVKVILH